MAFVELTAQRDLSTTGFLATSVAVTPGDVTAGNLLVMGGTAEGGNYPTFALTGGAVMEDDFLVLRAGRSVSGISFIHIAIGVVGTGGPATVTRTLRNSNGGGSTSAYGGFMLTEFQGIGRPVLSVDNNDSSTSPSPGSFAVRAGDLILGTASYRVNTSITQPSGWTLVGEFETYAGNDVPIHLAYKIATSDGTETPTWTLGSSGPWAVQAVVLRPVESGGGGGVSRARVVNG